jgi:hypothetical protein
MRNQPKQSPSVPKSAKLRFSNSSTEPGNRPAPELVSRVEDGAANPELDADALGVHPGELLEK